MRHGQRKQIGRWEWIALPEFAIACVKACIDRDAEISRLRVADLRDIELAGKPAVSFRVHPFEDDPKTFILVEARPSLSSDPHRRIRTQIVLGDECWPVELELVEHEDGSLALSLGAAAWTERFVHAEGEGLIGPPAFPAPGARLAGRAGAPGSH